MRSARTALAGTRDGRPGASVSLSAFNVPACTGRWERELPTQLSIAHQLTPCYCRHISKVKSLTLDTWTREQVDKMKEMGNIKSNQIFNPDPLKNRAPTNMTEEERDR